jgi:hypothetical protein
LNGPEFCQGVGAFLFFLRLLCLLFFGFASFGEVVFRVGVGVVGVLFYLKIFAFLGVCGVSLSVCRIIP